MELMKGSKEVAKAAVEMAITATREDENALKEELKKRNIKAAAVDYGGEFNDAAKKIVERAVVAAKRENLIEDCHVDEGAIAGATHEALSAIIPKAMGLNVGGKIGIARHGDHVSVVIFFGIGLLHLDEVAIGMGHRAIRQSVISCQ